MRPAYQSLREQLRSEIAAGRYRDGTRLPTESELVARHGLSRQTVRRAFQDLVAEGAVYRVPGRGTYASEPGRRYLRQLGSIEDLMSLSDDTTMEVLAGLRRRVDVDAASRLRLADDVVYSVAFRRLRKRRSLPARWDNRHSRLLLRRAQCCWRLAVLLLAADNYRLADRKCRASQFVLWPAGRGSAYERSAVGTDCRRPGSW